MYNRACTYCVALLIGWTRSMPQGLMVKPAGACRHWADTDIPVPRCCQETSGVYGAKALELTQDMRIVIDQIVKESLLVSSVLKLWKSLCVPFLSRVLLNWTLIVFTNHIKGNDKARTVCFQARIQQPTQEVLAFGLGSNSTQNSRTHDIESEMGAHTVLATHTTCLFLVRFLNTQHNLHNLFTSRRDEVQTTLHNYFSTLILNMQLSSKQDLSFSIISNCNHMQHCLFCTGEGQNSAFFAG